MEDEEFFLALSLIFMFIFWSEVSEQYLALILLSPRGSFMAFLPAKNFEQISRS